MASSIIQEWGAADISAAGTGPGTSANASAASIEQLVRRTALENGVERPRGYDVSFHYNPDVEQFHFGRSHPMKQWRLQLTKQLVLSYGLQYAMDLYHTREASKEEMAAFHEQDYLDFLEQVAPGTYDPATAAHYNFGDDCPVFDGVYSYCTLYSGATLSAARTLTSSLSSIAINWSGGLHHAQKQIASGFCYVNDIVLAILELLRVHPRVLYIDIDVHHGDGVEAAFASSDRVMTLSYHKYDPDTFFPGTGGIHDTGPDNKRNPGAHHSLNVPLKDGIDDAQYDSLFSEITGSVIEAFQPTALVLQCGADSLGGDRLGKFNLNIRAHGRCVEFVKKYRLPLLIVGGGGYTARNVARLWCHETSLCVGAKLADDLPGHIPYRRAFEGAENGDGVLYPELHNIEGKRHRNEHDRKYLDGIVAKIHEQLRYLKGAPSVAMREIPRDIWGLREEIDAGLRDEREDREGDEEGRRAKERRIGGRGELL